MLCYVCYYLGLGEPLLSLKQSFIPFISGIAHLGSKSTSLNGLADWLAVMMVYSDVRVKNIERYLPLALVATFIS